MTRNQFSITGGMTGFFICGFLFVVSVLQQFAMVEVVTCIAACLELFFTTMTVVDAFDDKQANSPLRGRAAVIVPVAVALFYLATNHFHWNL
ncbi:MAG: hypothetical protein NVS1B11_34090 [Terriglobales bacterium]